MVVSGSGSVVVGSGSSSVVVSGSGSVVVGSGSGSVVVGSGSGSVVVGSGSGSVVASVVVVGLQLSTSSSLSHLQNDWMICLSLSGPYTYHTSATKMHELTEKKAKNT